MTQWLLVVIFLSLGTEGEVVYSNRTESPRLFQSLEECEAEGVASVDRQVQLYSFDKYEQYIVKHECIAVHPLIEGGKVVWPKPKRMDL